MRRRTLAIAFTAAALFGLLSVPAHAELHRVSVVLVTGQELVTTVDVPPGQTVQSVTIPGLPAPAASVTDLGPVATPTPSPTATATPGASAPPKADAPNTASGDSDERSRARGKRKDREEEAPAGNTEAQEGAIPPAATPAPPAAAPAPTSAPGATAPAPPAAVDPLRAQVPNFFLERFRIPPFLLSIYQAAGIEYGVRWEVLAAINEIETDYGRNLNVSSAGALGWMQFMPATWKAYGVDGNRDGLQDPYNPVDAIFAAARYLKAAGADRDLRAAIFAYNHADWYVDSVLLRARLIGGLPGDLVGSLTGLTQGRFPVAGKARYTGGRRRGIDIFTRDGAAVVAVNDGRIVRAGRTPKLGAFIRMQDVYGNTYTYAHLDRVAQTFPAPRPAPATKGEIAAELALPDVDAAPAGPASTTTRAQARARRRAQETSRRRAAARRRAPAAPGPAKERLFANPARPNAAAAGGADQAQRRGEDYDAYLQRVFGLDRSQIELRPLRRGARVTAGTVLGRVGATVPGAGPHVRFTVRPAGRGAPMIDPKPILDGWKLLESTAIYRAAGRDPFSGPDAAAPSIGQILLMSKDVLARRVLANPNIQIYACGRRDIRAGQIDRRVLATLEFLAGSGLKPTVSSLTCGHSYLTRSGNVSEHSHGSAVDIPAINGVPVLGHQGPGSITELAVQRLLTLQGTMKPHQIITLMRFPGTDNTYAMDDHADHIHIGFRPLYGTNRAASRRVEAILRPAQWIKLIERLGQIDNPPVADAPSRYATQAPERP